MKPKAPYSFLKLSFLKPALLGSAALAAWPALAQQVPADSAHAKSLNEVVVTASRAAVPKNKTPQSITVITARDLALTPAQEFTDVLKKNAALNVIQYPGLSAGVGIRGFRPQFSGINQRTLLLVDGRPAGTVNLATINPADIVRVEVLKGAASALYGSQAMGGVVNVITRKSSGKIATSILAEYGSYQTFKASATSGGHISPKTDYDLSFTSFDRHQNIKLGQDNLLRTLLDAGAATKYYAEGPREEDDRRADGLRRQYTRLGYHTGSLRLGYQLHPQWRVDLKGERFAARNVEAPSDITFGNSQPSTKDLDRASGELTVSGQLGAHQLSLRGYAAGENNFNNTLVAAGVPIVPYLSFQSSTDWQGLQLKDVVPLRQHSLLFGLDHSQAATQTRAYNANQSERAPYSPNSGLISTAAYAQGQLRWWQEKLILSPGLRYDLITYSVASTPLLTSYTPGAETRPFISPSLAGQYRLWDALTVHGSLGRAFVTPDAYQVAGYSEAIGANKKAAVTQGNAALTPENSLTWDAGLRWEQKKLGLQADLTWFRTHVNDRITTQRTVPAAKEYTASGYEIASRTTYRNVNEANLEGLEAELGYDFGTRRNLPYRLRLFANATLMRRAEEVTIAADGSRSRRDIFNVANQTLNYGLEYGHRTGLDLRLQGRYVGQRQDTDFNDPQYPQIEYPAFMVLDFSAAYRYAKQHSLTLLVNNITDENYYEKRGYNLPGRNYALRYGFSF